MSLRIKRCSLITLARSVCTVRKTGLNVCISNHRRFPKMCCLCLLYYFKKPGYQLARTLFHDNPSDLPSGSGWRYDGLGATTLEEVDQGEF